MNIAQSDETCISARVGFIDTDAGGVAHHSSYLRWMEQARTEWVRARGCSLSDLTDQGIVCAVVSISVHYRKSLRLDDTITATARMTATGRSSCEFAQQIIRNKAVCCSAQVRLACINPATGRPVRIPSALRI